MPAEYAYYDEPLPQAVPVAGPAYAAGGWWVVRRAAFYGSWWPARRHRTLLLCALLRLTACRDVALQLSILWSDAHAVPLFKHRAHTLTLPPAIHPHPLLQPTGAP